MRFREQEQIIVSIVDIRTPKHLMSDLLQKVIDDQWSDQSNIDCHCHPRYVPSCPECSIPQWTQNDWYGPQKANKHEEDCRRLLLIKEVQAYLRVENDLAKKRGDENIYIPEM